eukprot:6318363-Pyramimonas_sp.AAC.1
MANTKATATSTKSRRRIRFDVRTVDYYFHTISGRARLDRWKGLPNEGGIVQVPDPLPQKWWDESAEALRECQKEAQLWYDELYDYRHNKES